jgi:amino acid adenylation domain-containing protein
MRQVSHLDVVDGRSLRSGFLRSAARAPDAVAMDLAGTLRTYGEMERTARVWAGAILGSLPARPERVGVFAHRSDVSYTGTLAALFTGAAFVPLNRNFPLRRTAEMAQNALLDAVIVDPESWAQLLEIWDSLEGAPPVLAPAMSAAECSARASMRVITRSDLESAAPLDHLPAVQVDEMAYLLYTSGSTGKPKGVAVNHVSVLCFLDVMSAHMRISPADRFSQTYDQTFDPSIFDLFLAWENGASVCAMRPIDRLAPTTYVNKNEITIWSSVPTIPILMRKKNLLRRNSMPTVRYSLFCGAPLPLQTAEEWQQATPNGELLNYYGPTETTVVCSGHRYNSERSPAQCHNGLVPIGKLFEGHAGLVLGEDDAPVGVNEEGELLVAGPQVAMGYWRDPEKTRQKFVDIAISATTTKRFYRTGDRVIFRENGEYVFVGRVDGQIKVLGRRIELGEIEAVLNGCAGVTNAVAGGWPIEDGHPVGIIAFVSGSNLDVDGLKRVASEYLPSYMVPAQIYNVDEWPLNSNGKIDRDALLRTLVEAPSVKAAG